MPASCTVVASPDSDYDLRGVHLLPLEEVVGLKTGQETVAKSGIHDGLEIDLVTHDARKFFGLLLNPITGPALRRLLARKLFGSGNGFVYQGNGSKTSS